jgi:hypothetical protein
VRAVAAKDAKVDLLVRALAISLVLHLFAFGTWKYGQTHGWWRESHMPHWLQVVRSKLVQQMAKTIPPRTKPPQQTLTFVDVDQTQAVAEAPKNAKYTSSVNTIASSTKRDDSELPRLTGDQEKVLKTTDNAKPEPKPQPLQPTPKPLPEREKPAPPPKSYTPGQLVFAKPYTNANNGKTNEPEAAPHQRPRTVQEAKAHQGISGDKMKHDAGSSHVGLTSALDVKSTITGNYDRMFVDVVQTQWNYLTDDHRPFPPGEVQIQFKLHYDGRITDMKTVYTTVDGFYAMLCQKAILDNVPYQRWTVEMRRELAADVRDLTFTFYYLSR